MELRQIFNAVKSFFFKPHPVHSAAVLRILFGVLLLYHWGFVWNHLALFWSSEGLVTLQTAQDHVSSYRFSLFDYLPDVPQAAGLICTVHLIAVIGMILGLFTRASIVIAFLTLASIHSRNPFLLNGADTLLRNLLFFLIFLPSGDVYSLDRVWKKWRGTAPAMPLEKEVWGLRLFQLQFCAVYISTVLFKIKGNTWIDGTAVYYATRLDDFVRVSLPVFDSILFIKISTWGTLIAEVALGLLVWVKELRYWVLLTGVCLHMGMELTMNIPMFEWVMLVGISSMIPSEDILKVQNWVLKKFNTRHTLVDSSLDMVGLSQS